MYNLIYIPQFRLRSELSPLSRSLFSYFIYRQFPLHIHLALGPNMHVFDIDKYCTYLVSPAAVPEQTNRVWKEVLSASYSSSTSGNWSWDASDQSVPSTPSPPLSNGASKNFLLSPQADDGAEDGPESTHFMFEDPIPRKRKVGRSKGILIRQIQNTNSGLFCYVGFKNWLKSQFSFASTLLSCIL